MAKKDPSITLPKTNKPKEKERKTIAKELKEMREVLGDISADIILDPTLTSTKTLDDLKKDKTVQQSTSKLKTPPKQNTNTKSDSNTSGGKSYT